MRRMSFSMTEAQLLDGSKTVTRRLGFKNVKVGDEITAIRKGMGLKKGEKQHILGVITVVSARSERVMHISLADCRREGFPLLSPSEFCAMFCKAMKCMPYEFVTVIGFTFKDATAEDVAAAGGG